ncbi:hypothetical protein GBAR_LOCUS22364 [Geodia barretti]|uniref:Uncharacterized protein n=1 Tax=Geodia barretti TaxID=519541 RepID=A0AA35T3L9_GEOBA|nr:hypothetical protein GBAR_LOCUS22364 [Geodia barretti]
MSTTAKPQEISARKDPGAPRERGPATVSSPGSRQQQSRGKKRSHPRDAMDDAPPNVKLPTAEALSEKDRTDEEA